MIVRKAVAVDSAKIAFCIYLAMDEILLQFLGCRDKEKALGFLEMMASRRGNQYSYENCLVAEQENEVLAVAVMYDGADLQVLRAPVIQEIAALSGRRFIPEDETRAGELYIDCIGVDPQFQGKGIGTVLLQEIIRIHGMQGKRTIGLLVEKAKPKAKQLYLKLGFVPVGEKTLAGKEMDHLQFLPHGKNPAGDIGAPG